MLVVYSALGVASFTRPQPSSVGTVRVENFEVFLISRFAWVADDTKIIHVEGGINTREIF